MRFGLYFKRQLGGGTTDPLLGSDTAPTVSTTRIQKDCVFATKVPPQARPTQRLAIGYWYEGGGGAVDIPVTIWAWEETSGKYYKASTGTLKSGEIAYFRMPCPGQLPQTQANLATPASGVDAFIQVANNTGANGTFHFVVGADDAQF
jgi:hypothetical protein